MDVISIIAETLQIVYTYVPQEVVIIFLAGITILIYESVKNGKKG